MGDFRLWIFGNQSLTTGCMDREKFWDTRWVGDSQCWIINLDTQGMGRVPKHRNIHTGAPFNPLYGNSWQFKVSDSLEKGYYMSLDMQHVWSIYLEYKYSTAPKVSAEIAFTVEMLETEGKEMHAHLPADITDTI